MRAATTTGSHRPIGERAARAGVLAAALALTACHGGPPASAPPAAPGVTVVDRSGGTLLSITDGRVEVHRSGDAVVQPAGRGWSIPEAAKVSGDSDAIKLKDAAGATTWKVKLGDKVKVLQGEESVVCEVSSPEPGRYKARSAGGQELGAARADGGGTRLQEGTDTNIGTSTAPPAESMAVLFCADVPAPARAVVIGELARRGR